MIKLKEVLYIGASALLLTLISGCSSSNLSAKNPACGKDTVGAPSWVCQPQIADGYGGLGVAEKNAANPEKMKQEALKNARLEIAKQMQTQVKEKLDTLSKTAEINNKEAVDNLFKSISKEVLKTQISLEKDAKSWKSSSGKLYVLAVAPKSNFDEDLKKAVLSSYTKDRDPWLNYLSNQSLDNFEKEFALTMPKKKETTIAQSFKVETINEMQVGRNRRK